MAKPLYSALFFLGALLLYSMGNWSLPLIDRDEPRFAEASREMRQSGDFLIPRLNGDYRFDKPPLIYWCQVLSYDVLGENDFAARFPSAIFAALTGVATWIFSSRIFGPRIGLWSGIIFATSLQVFIHARAAVADMPLVFFFLTATWADWERLRNPRVHILVVDILPFSRSRLPRKRSRCVAPCFLRPHPVASQSYPLPFKLRSALLGGLVVLVVIGLWGLPALIATNGAYLQIGLGKHVLQRSLQPMESHGGAGLAGYLLFLPFIWSSASSAFFRGVFFLPGCVKRLLAHREPDENYLLGPILIVLFVFTSDSDQVAALRPSGLPDARNPGGPASCGKQMEAEAFLGCPGPLSSDRSRRISSYRTGISVKEHRQNRASSHFPGNANGIAQLRRAKSDLVSARKDAPFSPAPGFLRLLGFHESTGTGALCGEQGIDRPSPAEFRMEDLRGIRT